MSLFEPAGPPLSTGAPPRRAPVPAGGAPIPQSASGSPRPSPFRAARAAAEIRNACAPPRTVILPLGAWKTTYPDRPAGDVEVGLRVYAEAEAVLARAAAAQEAWRLHPQESDEDERVAAGNGALMARIVACCATKPDDARRPYFGAEDLVALALNPKGVEFLFEHVNGLLVEDGPTVPEADDEDLCWLAEQLGAEDPCAGLGPLAARRARRLLGAAIEIMRGESDG